MMSAVVDERSGRRCVELLMWVLGGRVASCERGLAAQPESCLGPSTEKRHRQHNVILRRVHGRVGLLHQAAPMTADRLDLMPVEWFVVSIVDAHVIRFWLTFRDRCAAGVVRRG